MKILPFLFQTAFTLTQLPGAVTFSWRTSHFQKTQECLLFEYLRRNQETVFGRTHHFGAIRSIQEYRQQVPIRTYHDFLPYIMRIQQGEPQVLTTEPVRYFLPTGGTSGTKLIPYTTTLQQEFQGALAPWLADIARSFPTILGGKTYWLMTPPGHRLKTLDAGQIPVGFEDDTAYFGRKGALLGHIFAVPSWITHVRSMENFRFLTLYFLLREENLRWMSIWSPTFLLVVLDELAQQTEGLLASLHDGFPHLPADDPLSVRWPWRPLPKRAKTLAAILASDSIERYQRIWPRLAFISLWTAAYAHRPARRLQQYFPRTYFQGKGLLATEGVTTIPLQAAGGCVPAVTSHFFEFLDNHQQPHTLWELEPGATYSLLLTTGGGFYRYAIGDMVQVTHFYQNLPVLKFLGRTGRGSDLVGEKLEESFVTTALGQSLTHCPLDHEVLLVAPETESEMRGYVLYIETPAPLSLIKDYAHHVETALRQNIHYAYAVELGQLQPLRVFRVERNGSHTYLQRCLDDGQQLGDIKPLVFDTRTGWSSWFQGRFLDLAESSL